MKILKQKIDVPIIKAIQIKNDDSFNVDYDVDYYLFDHGSGGTGESFDWSMLKEVNKPVFLAGGINLSNIDENIFIFTHLEVVDLSENFLVKISENIQKLINLKSLILSDNKIENLPNSIGNLTQLENLYLAGNNLSELPKDIIQLQNLKWLSLIDNEKLILTDKQKMWLKSLEEKGCKVLI